jgi:hypothetical protein
MFTQVRALLGGNTLRPALVYYDGIVQSTEYVYLEIYV